MNILNSSPVITQIDLENYELMRKMVNDNANLATFNTDPNQFNTIFPKYNNRCEYCSLTDTEILKSGHSKNCGWIELATKYNKLKKQFQ